MEQAGFTQVPFGVVGLTDEEEDLRQFCVKVCSLVRPVSSPRNGQEILQEGNSFAEVSCGGQEFRMRASTPQICVVVAT